MTRMTVGRERQRAISGARTRRVGLSSPVVRSKIPAGQASVEYVAAVSLVAALLAGAAAVASPPALAHALSSTVRTGVCIVGGDICRSSDARAAGLPPCTVADRTRGYGGAVTVATFRFGDRGQYTVAQRSDGTVGVVVDHTPSAASTFGVGVTAEPVGLDVGAGASLEYSIGIKAGWEFADAARARDFVQRLPGSALHPHAHPAAWRTVELGDRGVAAIGATLGWRPAVGLETSLGAATGARVGRDGTVTAYVRVQSATPHGTGWLASVGRGATTLLAEYTKGREGPRELAFRRAQPGRDGGVVETVGRLDLHDPANRALAEPLISRGSPSPAAVARAVGAVSNRMATRGVVERATYAVDDDSSRFSVRARLGAGLGIDLDRTKVARRLVSATARIGGGPERRRVDCVPEDA